MDRPPYESWLNPEGYRGNVAIDVGANAGQWSHILAQNFKTVHAFEPHPRAATAILDLINSGDDNIELHNSAVGNVPGHRKLYRYANLMHTCATDWHGSEGNALGSFYSNFVRLDDAVPFDAPVGLIKVDIEGYELDALQSGSRLIRRFHPEIVIEAHSVPSQQKLMTWLNDIGYGFELVRHPRLEEGSTAWEVNCWLLARHRSGEPAAPARL